jgi:hypothetical protein
MIEPGRFAQIPAGCVQSFLVRVESCQDFPAGCGAALRCRSSSRLCPCGGAKFGRITKIDGVPVNRKVFTTWPVFDESVSIVTRVSPSRRNSE